MNLGTHVSLGWIDKLSFDVYKVACTFIEKLCATGKNCRLSDTGEEKQIVFKMKNKPSQI